jgi:hypothetical protein
MLPSPTSETADPGAGLPSERSEWDTLLGEIAVYSAIITGYYLGEGPATPVLCQQAPYGHSPLQGVATKPSVGYDYGRILET